MGKTATQCTRQNDKRRKCVFRYLVKHAHVFNCYCMSFVCLAVLVVLHLLLCPARCLPYSTALPSNVHLHRQATRTQLHCTARAAIRKLQDCSWRIAYVGYITVKNTGTPGLPTVALHNQRCRHAVLSTILCERCFPCPTSCIPSAAKLQLFLSTE